MLLLLNEQSYPAAASNRFLQESVSPSLPDTLAILLSHSPTLKACVRFIDSIFLNKLKMLPLPDCHYILARGFLSQNCFLHYCFLNYKMSQIAKVTIFKLPKGEGALAKNMWVTCWAQGSEASAQIPDCKQTLFLSC